MNLKQLAEIYGTDKRESQHNYVKMYEKMLELTSVNSLLEIGLGSGASLRMWRSYFPEGKLYCIEYFEDENRINWHSANGSDIEGLIVFPGDSSKQETWEKIPYDLDVIIDDGSHEPDTQINTLLVGFPHLKSGGLYFIEDTHSSMQDIFYKDGHCKLYDLIFYFIMKQQEAKDNTGNGGNFYSSVGNMENHAANIFSYHFYKSVIVLERS